MGADIENDAFDLILCRLNTVIESNEIKLEKDNFI